MRTAAGTCLLTSVTHEQVDDLEEALAVRVSNGWISPEGLVHLRDSIEGTVSKVLNLCPDCGVQPGQFHVDGCDVERCRFCGGQAISCGCPSTKLVPRLPWTGEWPGAAECKEFGWYARFVGGMGWMSCEASDPGAGPDLNRLYTHAKWDIAAGRFVKKT